MGPNPDLASHLGAHLLAMPIQIIFGTVISLILWGGTKLLTRLGSNPQSA